MFRFKYKTRIFISLVLLTSFYSFLYPHTCDRSELVGSEIKGEDIKILELQNFDTLENDKEVEGGATVSSHRSASNLRRLRQFQTSQPSSTVSSNSSNNTDVNGKQPCLLRTSTTNKPTMPPFIKTVYNNNSELGIPEMSADIRKLNTEQRIYNLEEFGPLNENTSVLVIQTHFRPEYLKHVVDSLSRLRNVDNSLIIFSHDFYVPDLNEDIRNLKFARIMQIFFPNSIQLTPPNEFPGYSPVICPRNMNRKNLTVTTMENLRCKNYSKNRRIPRRHRKRNAVHSQIKHHWWWKANFVFGRLNVLRNHTGIITFIEDDSYLAPDSLWILRLLESSMVENHCKGCNILSLGNYKYSWMWHGRTQTKSTYSETIVADEHVGIGMAFNRTMWKKFQSCAPVFCRYDDYNWDWTLRHVSHKCLKKPLKMMFPKVPRIFHIGACGVHHDYEECDRTQVVEVIQRDIHRRKEFMYPPQLKTKLSNMALPGGQVWGGWGDVRDEILCLSFVVDLG